MYAKLEGEAVVPVADVVEWCSWMDQNAHTRVLGRDEVSSKYIVSTVFLGTQRPGGFWFETSVFKSNDTFFVNKYQTYADAKQGHKTTLDMLQGARGLLRVAK